MKAKLCTKRDIVNILVRDDRKLPDDGGEIPKLNRVVRFPATKLSIYLTEN